jgi:hypothetical protein
VWVVNVDLFIDEAYTYGSTNEVLVGYDEDRNYGICRFKVYGKDNELEYNYLITCRYLDLVKNQKIENVQVATTI